MTIPSRLRRVLAVGGTALAVLGTTAPGHAATPAPRSAAPAATTAVRDTVITSNIDFGNKAPGQRAQVAHVISYRPDIVMLQELRELDLAKPGGTIKDIGNYGIVQFWSTGAPYQRESGILYLKSHFTLVQKGLRVGYQNAALVQPTARFLPWAILKDKRTGNEVAVVSEHLPKDAGRDNKRGPASTAAYKTMDQHYEALVRSFQQRGLPVLTAGDWNLSVKANNPKVGYDPVDTNRAVTLHFNWALGTPCAKTQKNGTIDGVAMSKSVVLHSQACLPPDKSDHDPVEVVVTPPNTPGKAS